MPIPFLDPSSEEYLTPSNPQDRRMLEELASLAVSKDSTELECTHFLRSYELMIDGHLGPINTVGLTLLLQRFQELYINTGSRYALDISVALRSRFRQLVNDAVDPSATRRPTDLDMLHLLRDVRREMVSSLRDSDLLSPNASIVAEYRERGYAEFRSDPTRTDIMVRDTLRDHMAELEPVETRGRR